MRIRTSLGDGQTAIKDAELNDVAEEAEPQAFYDAFGRQTAVGSYNPKAGGTPQPKTGQ